MFTEWVEEGNMVAMVIDINIAYKKYKIKDTLFNQPWGKKVQL